MWKQGITSGHWWQAKVYDEPSQFGINGGRVSKLVIARGSRWEGMNHIVNTYDRGPDVDRTPPGLLDAVLAAACTN